MRFGLFAHKMRKSVIAFVLFICLGNFYLSAAEPNIEQLFKEALDLKGKDYIEARQKILNLQLQNDSYLKEQAESSDLQTRIIAQAILERAAKPQEYRHFEELMIVPITIAAKYGRNFRNTVSPFETIKGIANNSVIWDNSRSGSITRMVISEQTDITQQTQSHSYGHDKSAFLFLTEMALKNTMLDVPELSEQIEWTNEEKTYTTNKAAEMLGVSPQTFEKWYQAGLFLIQWDHPRLFVPMQTDSNDSSDSITQLQIKNFYEYFSDKIINPEYLKSTQSVSRVVHADAIDAAKRFRQDPGSLSRCYAILMIRNFAKPETHELLYEIYKDDSSEYARLYCVEGFSAQTQVEQIREAMKDYSLVVESDDNELMDTPEVQKTTKVPCVRVRHAAVIKSKENPDAFTASDYIKLITYKGNHLSDKLNNEIIQILIAKDDIAAIDPLIELFEYSYSYHGEVIKAINAIDPNSMYKLISPLIKLFEYSSSYHGEVIKAINTIDPNSMYKLLEHTNSNIRGDAWLKFVSLDLDFPLEKDYLVKKINSCNTYESDMIWAIMSLIAKNYPNSLFSFMENTNPTVRRNTLVFLVSDPEKYLPKESPPIKELLLSYYQDPGIRRTVLNSLSKYSSDNQVYDLFLDALKDTNYMCRIAAINNLKESAETVSILEDILMQEKDASVLIFGIEKLRFSKEPLRYRVFVKLINDENPEVREIAAGVLSDWEDNQAIEIFKSLLNDPDSDVQKIAIGNIAQRDIALLSEIIPIVGPELRQTAYNYLRQVQTNEAIDILIKGTQDENTDVQNSALWALMKQKYSKELDDPVVSAVRKCLSDDNPEIRSNAIYALYEMIGDKSFQIIAVYLYDSDTSVKSQAIGTLMRFNNPEVLKLLMEALAKEEDKETLVQLVSALREITGNLLTKDEWLKWWGENKETYLNGQYILE